MLHIADRRGRSACGGTEGASIPHNAWKWKEKHETCKVCAEIYKARRIEYNVLRLEER